MPLTQYEVDYVVTRDSSYVLSRDGSYVVLGVRPKGQGGGSGTIDRPRIGYKTIVYMYEVRGIKILLSANVYKMLAGLFKYSSFINKFTIAKYQNLSSKIKAIVFKSVHKSQAVICSCSKYTKTSSIFKFLSYLYILSKYQFKYLGHKYLLQSYQYIGSILKNQLEATSLICFGYKYTYETINPTIIIAKLRIIEYINKIKCNKSFKQLVNLKINVKKSCKQLWNLLNLFDDIEE